ncbi:hypothetical protein MKW98_018643 [Papaver atlanticum]|uniref:Uncharacterized protein n=1 Tax=Papaver atlanticum TaxID=357466 RepID=A0AAD4XQP4_9MAGN|nr:hypothetical protein MKW98_018643 [Papaver atlanticum]
MVEEAEEYEEEPELENGVAAEEGQGEDEEMENDRENDITTNENETGDEVVEGKEKRKHANIPLTFKDWRVVPKEAKANVWKIIKMLFLSKLLVMTNQVDSKEWGLERQRQRCPNSGNASNNHASTSLVRENGSPLSRKNVVQQPVGVPEKNRACKLLSWYVEGEIVAEAVIADTDPKKLIHGMPIGFRAYKILCILQRVSAAVCPLVALGGREEDMPWIDVEIAC